jgi:hypothetical protein
MVVAPASGVVASAPWVLQPASVDVEARAGGSEVARPDWLV